VAIFSKTVVAEEGMATAPPLGMATVRTSMAIAGGSDGTRRTLSGSGS